MAIKHKRRYTIEPKKVKYTRISKKARIDAHLAHAKWLEANIQIRKSTIPMGGGVYYVGDTPLKPGSLIGFYRGKPGSAVHGEKGYEFEIGDGGRNSRNAYDRDGRLKLNSNRVVDPHHFTMLDWDKMEKNGEWGKQWLAGDGLTNWCRFINHASGNRRSDGRFRANCSVATTKEKYGYSHAIYVRRMIKPGEELFYNYGNGFLGFFKAAGVEPMDPED